MSPFWISLELRMMEVVWNLSYRTCNAPAKSSPPTNDYPDFHMPDALPLMQPSMSEHGKVSHFTDFLTTRKLNVKRCCKAIRPVIVSFQQPTEARFGKCIMHLWKSSPIKTCKPTASSLHCCETVSWATGMESSLLVCWCWWFHWSFAWLSSSTS